MRGRVVGADVRAKWFSRLRSPVSLLLVGYALLMLAWLMATPPFGGYDEPAHYVRAVGISEGKVLGARTPLAYELPFPPAANPVRHAWAQRDTRGVVVPARLAPAGMPCLDGARDGHGACVVPTWVGDYPPASYALPALAIKLAHGPVSGDRLGRAGAAVLNLVLLALAILLLWDGSAVSLVGVLAAVTPMALFLGSILNPNGLEVAGSIAACAAVLRVVRDKEGSPKWVWVALGASCVVTMLARQLDPVWVAASLALIPALLTRRHLSVLARRRRRPLGLAFGFIGLASVVYVWWSVYASNAHPVNFLPLGSFELGARTLYQDVRDGIGFFGWGLNVWIPRIPKYAWLLVLGALIALSLRLGTRRERGALLGTICAVAVFAVVFYAGVYRLSGFGMNGRDVLGLFVIVPLLAGEIVLRHAGKLSARESVTLSV